MQIFDPCPVRCFLCWQHIFGLQRGGEDGNVVRLLQWIVVRVQRRRQATPQPRRIIFFHARIRQHKLCGRTGKGLGDGGGCDQFDCVGTDPGGGSGGNGRGVGM